MNLNTRSLGLALLLLLLFLGAAVTLQWWLQRETRLVQAMAGQDLRSRLNLVLAATGRPAAGLTEDFRHQLEVMLGGTVEFVAPGAALPPPKGAPNLTLVQEMPGAPGWRIRVAFATPAVLRVQILNQRIMAAIVLLALLLALVPLLVVLLDSRRTLAPEAGTRSPWAASRAQAVGIEHFAKMSNDRGAALAEEHGARVRAEEDLQVNRSLLDRSVGERIRLGRELHDNISQTLYAVCLTLESVQKKNTLAAPLQQRIEQCMGELRRLNLEVRAYLVELEPARVHGQSFATGIAAMVSAFASDAGVKFEHKLDEEALALISPAQSPEIMNILREAVSNSLRHGHARTITLLAGRSENQIALAVQDDGAGFTPSPAGAGHGLTNMQARAAALGGDLHLESLPGKGTRIRLTLPVPSLT